MQKVEIRHLHLFCGLGGGAKGFNKGQARVGNLEARFRCIGGIDVDPAAICDFDHLSGTKGTVLDLFTREQYRSFHGKEPGSNWREATIGDIHAASGGERPHIIFLSAPCKGFSGLLSQAKSGTEKYQALNALTLRGVWLALEAYKDDPVEFFIFENVPRIQNRGRALLDQITALFRQYGYAVAETTHDCGELGGLAQSRKRFLLVARHQEKVPAFLYEPDRRPLRSVGDVLGRMPLPGDPRGGPMHRIPALQWKTWVRLAFVKAGSDWRSLRELAVENGVLRDYLIVPEYRRGYLGVHDWDATAGTVAGRSTPTNGTFSVADVRFNPSADWADGQAYGVRRWSEPTGTITGQNSPGQGNFSVADIRPSSIHHNNIFRVVRLDQAAGTVTGGHGPSSGGQAVADPRCETYAAGYGVVGWEQAAGTVAGESLPSNGKFAVADVRPPEGPLFSKYAVTDWSSRTGTVIGGDDSGAYAVADVRGSGFAGKYHVSDFDQPAGTVISGSTTGHGAFAVGDPRPSMDRQRGDHYLTGGHYGVVPWDATCGAVAAAACHDNGRWAVADRRGTPEGDVANRDSGGEVIRLPSQDQKLICRIQALDGTWHRPFTTLELAALQSLVDPEDFLELYGTSDSAWRERIGNAVPPDAAEAMACVFGTTLLLAWSGETFILSNSPIWVRPIAIAIALPGVLD